MSDLYEVIEDSITDSQLPDEPQPTETPDPTETPEVAPETPEAPSEPVVEESTETPEVGSPAAKSKTEAKPEDLLGPPQSESGRENRIPYSRVKKITEKAVKEAETRVKSEVEASFTPKIQEFEAKIKDYDERLDKVAQFEHIMLNDEVKFLEMLSTLPKYAEIFRSLANPQGQPPVQPTGDEMPQPDQELPDGSKQYSMEGLKALLDWQEKRVEARVTSRYAPIESEWQAQQKMAAAIPKIKAQIDDARTWPMFNESEDEIVKALQDDPNINLEGAYRKVVFPKLQADRDKMRADLLKEVKQAPRSTATPTTASKSNPISSSTGPRSTEDIIAEAIKTLK